MEHNVTGTSVTLNRRNVGTALISYLWDTSGKFSASSCKMKKLIKSDLKSDLRWLVTASSTFQDLEFDGSL